MAQDARRGPWLVTAAVLLGAAAVLLAMGRVPICTCGTVELWHGEVRSAGNSQHLSDWYSPSHVIHGFLFYWLLWLALPGLSFGWRLAIATAVEAAWEIAENSPWIIDRYRAVTVSYDYYGDSVINSLSDILFMMLGFWLASRLPVRLTVALALAAEVMTTILIRDGLALNVLMLVWPIEAVRAWQAG
jgi:hypothetical protein